MKRAVSVLLSAALMLSVLTGCGKSGSVSKKNIPAEETAESKKIALSDSGITVDGAAISDDETAAVYAAQDIVYYEEGQGVAYGAGTDADAHSQEEADAHTVVYITQPGTYTLSGTLSAGQIAVDLGDGAEEDPEAVVTILPALWLRPLFSTAFMSAAQQIWRPPRRRWIPPPPARTL